MRIIELPATVGGPLVYSPLRAPRPSLQMFVFGPAVGSCPPVQTPHTDTWTRYRAELRRVVDVSTYEIWLEELALIKVTPVELTISAPRSKHAWIRDRFGRVMQACCEAVYGVDVTVLLVEADLQTTDPNNSDQPPPPPKRVGLNPKYNFEQFVIGEGNRLAHAAALAVAEQPGMAYNPLFLYGPPGLGKTHLLHAIAHYLAQHSPATTVRYITVEEFTNEFVAAVSQGGMDAFKATYRHVDVLLVDDVQFLERKARTEEEFFHTFNALYEVGSQLVITSDRLPSDMQALENRLRERFESGLVADVDLPDNATRHTILRMRALRDDLPTIDSAVLSLIAQRVTTNVRALEGALIRVVAFHSLSGRPLDVELATEVLDSLYPPVAPSKRSVEEIQQTIAKAFDISVEDLKSSSKAPSIAHPRHIAMLLSRELTPDSLPAIGRSFGGRNHSTVLSGCRSAQRRIEADQLTAQLVLEIKTKLGAAPTDRER